MTQLGELDCCNNQSNQSKSNWLTEGVTPAVPMVWNVDTIPMNRSSLLWFGFSDDARCGVSLKERKEKKEADPLGNLWPVEKTAENAFWWSLVTWTDFFPPSGYIIQCFLKLFFFFACWSFNQGFHKLISGIRLISSRRVEWTVSDCWNFSCCCSSKHTTAAATFHPSSFVPCPCRRANPQFVTRSIGFPSGHRDADVQPRVEPTPRRLDVKKPRQSRLRCIFPARRVWRSACLRVSSVAVSCPS